DRRQLMSAQANVSSATFDDAAGSLFYEDTIGDYGDKLIYNSVTVSDSAGNVTTVSDSTSQASFWPRTLSRATQLPSGSTEAIDAANYLLSIYKSPSFRFDKLSFIASLSDTL